MVSRVSSTLSLVERKLRVLAALELGKDREVEAVTFIPLSVPLGIRDQNILDLSTISEKQRLPMIIRGYI
jgi:hypothetical protein